MNFVENQNEVARKDDWYERRVFVEGTDCLGSESLEMTQSQRYLERWRFLKNLDFPVVDEMEITGKDTVRMTLMTGDGSEFFMKRKATHLVVEAMKKNKRELAEIEKKFVEIDPEEVLDDVDELRLKAWNLGFRLADDDPFDLLIHTDGTWEVILLDLERLSLVHEGDRLWLKEEHDFDRELFDAMRLNLERIST